MGAPKLGADQTCPKCGKTFYVPRSHTRKFCSYACARSGENNSMYGVRLTGERNPMHGRRRERSSNWRGGRQIRDDGYVLAIAPDDHPRPVRIDSGTKYVLEHRLVMERHLGRYLERREVVHHIDHDRTNNDISNLMLFASHAAHRLHHAAGH